MPFHKTTIDYCRSTIVVKLRRRPGFTLIELLVVIAIITILAGIAFVSYNNAREKSLDKKRKSDIVALKQALVAAKLDSSFYKNNITDGTLTPKYINKVPQDPELAADYIYIPRPPGCKVTSTCSSFIIIACLDNAKDAQRDTPTDSECDEAPYDSPASYTLTSPN